VAQGALVVNDPGNKFLAGATLTGDQDAGVYVRDPERPLDHRLHAFRNADDLVHPVAIRLIHPAQ
jgi:hypothetical protein